MDLTAQFFEEAKMYNSNEKDLSQVTYFQQKTHKKVFNFPSEIDFQLQNIALDLKQLQKLSKESSIFSDNSEQIQHLTCVVKDNLKLVEVSIQDLENIKCISKQQKQAVKISGDILNSGLLRVTRGLEKFLIAHSKVVQQQEIAKQNSHGAQSQIKGPEKRKRRIQIVPHFNAGQEDLKYEDLSQRDEDSMQVMAMESRQEYLEGITKTLQELSGMFKKFGKILIEQEVLVERIDKNTEQSLYDLERAKDELSAAYENVSGSRQIMLKIFFILLCFTTFYILFIL